MYTLTLNIFQDLILEHEMLPHPQEADEKQNALSDCLFVLWCDVHIIIRRQMTSTKDGCWCHTMQKLRLHHLLGLRVGV